MATPKTYVKNISMNIGNVFITGSLVPLIKSNHKKKSSRTLVAPDGGQVSQVYQASNGKIYRRGQLSYMSKDTGKMIDPDEYQEALTPNKLPKDLLSFTVHNRDEVEGQYWPDETRPYVFQPREDAYSLKVYDALFKVLSEQETILLTYGIVRDSEGMWRLQPWTDKLIIQKQVSPEHIAPSSFSRQTVATDQDVQTLKTMLNSNRVAFDPENYTNQQINRLTELMKSDSLPHEVIDLIRSIEGI